VKKVEEDQERKWIPVHRSEQVRRQQLIHGVNKSAAVWGM
jgi:hypothetical protein